MGEQRPKTETSAESDCELLLSAVYSTLNRERRRGLLRALDQSSEPIAMADAAEDVARRTTDDSNAEVSRTEIEKNYLELYHRDVPKLADGGYVDRGDDDTSSLTNKGECLPDAHEQLAQSSCDSR